MEKIFERALLNSEYINELLKTEVKTIETPSRTVVHLLDGTKLSMARLPNNNKKTGFTIRTDEITTYGDNIHDLAKYLDVLSNSIGATVESIKINITKLSLIVNIVRE